MINRFKNYESVLPYGDYERLPKGGYILQVMGASVGYSNSGTQYVKISCDIAEGEYENFFTDEYKANSNENKKWKCNYILSVPVDDGTERDSWTQRRFKTVIGAFEDSNEGYHFDWNETKLKGLIIGGLFNEREYEGNDGQVRRAINLAQLVPVSKIREGKFKVPDDKLLQTNKPVNEGFMVVPDGMEETGLPFA